METQGIIEPSTSAWAAPVVIVRKKDGTAWICVDFRKLNQVTKFDAHTILRNEDLLDTVGDADYITMLDLAKGYLQVPMEKDN